MNLPKHLYSLDISRGLAASAVVFWHWQHFFMKGSQLPRGFDRTEQPLYSLFSAMYEYGLLAVPFFFQLSGFIFFWLYREKVESRSCSVYEFAVLRFARLYPLHVLTLLLVLVLQIVHARLIGGYFVYPHNDAYHLALHAAFVSHWGFEYGQSFNAPVWSVSIEVGLYCLFFLYSLSRIPNAFKLTAVLLATGLAMKLGISGGRWPPAILAFFLGGLTFGCVNAYLQWKSRFVDTLILLTAVASWLGVLVSEPLEYWLLTRGHSSLFFLFPITIASLVVAEMKFPGVPKQAAWIGNISYSSYLLHFPLQLTLVLLVFVLGCDDTVLLSTFVLVVFLLLLFSLSLFSYHRVERPLQDWLRQKLLSHRFGNPSDSPESEDVGASATRSQPPRPEDR